MNENPLTPPSSTNKANQIKTPLVFTAVSATVFLVLGVFGVLFLNKQGVNIFNPAKTDGFEKFRTEQELRDYIAQGQQNFGFAGVGGFTGNAARDMAISESTASPGVSSPSALAQPDRISQTNVQVKGLDEPDIVKTDGKSIFFSNRNYSIFRRDVLIPDIYPYPIAEKTKIIAAVPPQNISLQSEIDEQGELLLVDNVLLVIANNKVTAFNTTDPSNPVRLWNHEYDENFTYNTARLMDGKVYLMTTRYADYMLPCPVPLLKEAREISVACTDIYRPTRPTPTNTVYSIVKMDPLTGSVENTLTFLGDAGSSVVYMSPNAIYTAYASYPNSLDFMANFLAENRGLFGDEVVNRVNALRSIDISNESKLNEVTIIFSRYLSSLSNDERVRIESELTNKMNDYIKAHGRELQVTSLIKINATSLEVDAMGEVPGGPLNQFSLDEWRGNLRIATTVSPSTFLGAGESANDVYVLDGRLNIIGSIQDLALGERIYSARFIENKAYVVTFRQIDPFFVIDLAQPTNPRVAGELKIPGFSSYLHPLAENLILGVGQEEGQSKLSVFDVSNPDNPVETSKYLLSEFYSEVQNNHHAFLLDPDHRVFFLPAGDSGYIFSWDGGLTLERAVANISARRAVYIGDYLYIIGDTKMVVLNEETWEEISDLEF